MNDLEPNLRESLSHHASTLPVHADPWARFSAAEGRHRRTRRIRRSIAAALVAAAVAGSVAAGALPDRGGTRLEPVGPAARLLDGPTRGGLADDDTFLRDLTARIPGLVLVEPVPGHPELAARVVPHADVDVLYAADVAGYRLALVATTVRFDTGDRASVLWFEGPTGTPASQLERGPFSTFDDTGYPIVTWDRAAEGSGTAVIVTTSEARVQRADSKEYESDGRIARTWEDVPVEDGIAVLEVPSDEIASGVDLRIGVEGSVHEVSQMFSGEIAGPDPAAVSRAVDVLLDTQPMADQQTTDAQVGSALHALDLDLADLTLAMPWAGTAHGRPSQLLTATLASGAVLAVAAHRTDATTIGTAATFLLPAKDAATRPLAWRASDGTVASESHVVVYAPGATTATVTSGTVTRTLALDEDGHADVALPPGTDLTVTATGKDGRTRTTTLPVGEDSTPSFDDPVTVTE